MKPTLAQGKKTTDESNNVLDLEDQSANEGNEHNAQVANIPDPNDQVGTLTCIQRVRVWFAKFFGGDCLVHQLTYEHIEKIKQFETALANERAKNEKQQSDLKDAGAENQKLKKELTSTRTEIQQLEKALARERAKIEKQQSDLKNAGAEIRVLKVELTSTRTEIRVLKDELTSTRTEIVDLRKEQKKQNQDHTKQIEDLKQDHTKQIVDLRKEQKKQIEDLRKDLMNQQKKSKRSKQSKM